MYTVTDLDATAPARPAGPDAERGDRADLSGYRAAHRAIRQAAHDLVGAMSTLRPIDARRTRAVRRYWEGYAGEVLVHHTIEDEICFPALVERVPAAAAHLARLDAEHHLLDEQMAIIGDAMARLDTIRGLADAEAGLVALAATMDAHLDDEDEHVLPLFEEHFTRAQYDVLDQKAVKAVPPGKQLAFTVPFVVAAMDDETRREAFAKAPRVMRLVYLATRGGHARLRARVFGPSEQG